MVILDEIGEFNIITEIFIRRRLMDQGKKRCYNGKRAREKIVPDFGVSKAYVGPFSSVQWLSHVQLFVTS